MAPPHSHYTEMLLKSVRFAAVMYVCRAILRAPYTHIYKYIFVLPYGL